MAASMGKESDGKGAEDIRKGQRAQGGSNRKETAREGGQMILRRGERVRINERDTQRKQTDR